VSEPVEKAPAHGQVIIVRSADDIVVGFEHEAEAKRFMMDLQQRMEQFALSLHPDKTRLIEFGRLRHRTERGAGLVSRKRSISLASRILADARARVSSTTTTKARGSRIRISMKTSCRSR
jgi:RNA-directed DNA polymerase